MLTDKIVIMLQQFERKGKTGLSGNLYNMFSGELFHGIYGLSFSMSVFFPLLSSEEASANCRPDVRGGLPIVSVSDMFNIESYSTKGY